MNITALLVDDEAHCLKALTTLLREKTQNVKIVAACTDGHDALQKIRLLKPNLLFLDVEMPGFSGLDLLAQLDKNQPIQVIFTTAHSRHAVEAFRFAAVDFLLKPITEENLRTAMLRAENSLKLGEQKRQFEALFEAIHVGKASKRIEKIALPFSDGLEIVPLNQISFLTAEEGYCNFHLADGRKLLVSRKIGEYEDLLDVDTFMRLHRSHIVNLNYVKKYQRGEGGQVQMSNGQWLEVSRAKKDALLGWLKV